MHTAALYEHYEQYVREYRSVLSLVDQLLAPQALDPAEAVRARRQLLGEDAVTAFVHVTERMQAQVAAGRMEVDVVLAALVYECCDKLTSLGEAQVAAPASAGERDQRRRRLVRPAERLFHGACQRLLSRGA
ncbi:hypothetical protein JOD97_000502 [Duganella sp. 1411]|jgi:hypothetical protein|uniref:hypothetical protein n=1 Tax=Duganella sp. 1411 TaxID=2806572 RepID=UPI001AE82FC3|nr:hypothetical protein [Duganella sp. 1411]MBP1202488.1 hypothetical protein [Duganella sp. 1411]